MMMKSVFWWRKPEYPEETTDLRLQESVGGVWNVSAYSLGNHGKILTSLYFRLQESQACSTFRDAEYNILVFHVP